MATSATEVSRAGYAPPEVLVDTAWVAAHRTDPKVKVVEVDVDTTAYEKGHVPGAIGLDWRKDLQAQPVRDLLPKDQFEALLSRHGTSADDTIIAYGDNNNWFAACFVWNLKYYGHRDVRLMEGGRGGRALGVRGRAEGALREQGRNAGQAGDRLLRQRGALVARLVRPPVPARIPERAQLRRVLGRVGPPDRGADRALARAALRT